MTATVTTTKLMEDLQLAVPDAEALLRATADEYVRDNPWQAVGVAAGIGLVIGLLVGRRQGWGEGQSRVVSGRDGSNQALVGFCGKPAGDAAVAGANAPGIAHG